jgi:hypothetical protein
MDREELVKKMKALKSKARAARKNGKKEIAATFRSATNRLTRKLRTLKAAVVEKVGADS